MDTERTNHQWSKATSVTPLDVIRSTLATIVEPVPLADLGFHVTIRVVAPDKFVMTFEKARTAGPDQRIDEPDGYFNGHQGGGRGNHFGGNGGEYGWVFDSLGPDDADSVNHLRVFREIGAEFQNGASSFRQISKRIAERTLNNCYPSDLPSSPAALTRCREAVVTFFDEQLVLDGDTLFELSGGIGGAMVGLTEKGWRLWEETTAYLIRRGFIPDDGHA